MSTQSLPAIAAEVLALLGRAPDVSLPELQRVELGRSRADTAWRIVAHVDEKAPGAAAAVYAWAAYAGGVVRVQTPYRSSVQPSGMQVSFVARVVVGGMRMQIVANLDADAYVAEMEQEAPARQQAAANVVHSGDAVFVHASTSSHDGHSGLVAMPDFEGGFEVDVDGVRCHFEASELESVPRRSRGWLVDAS